MARDQESEASKIDPESAEVWFDYGTCADPYGIYPGIAALEVHKDDVDYRCGECSDPSCWTYSLNLVRSPDSDILVWAGDLSEEVHRGIFYERRLESWEIPFIKELEDPVRPVRYFRRCSSMLEGCIVNDDSPRVMRQMLENEGLRAMALAAAGNIDLDTADVCLASTDGDPYDDQDLTDGEPVELMFVRNRDVWVPETYLPKQLQAELKARIDQKGIDLLSMDECDD
jgi:hypothetical protein